MKRREAALLFSHTPAPFPPRPSLKVFHVAENEVEMRNEAAILIGGVARRSQARAPAANETSSSSSSESPPVPRVGARRAASALHEAQPHGDGRLSSVRQSHPKARRPGRASCGPGAGHSLWM